MWFDCGEEFLGNLVGDRRVSWRGRGRSVVVWEVEVKVCCRSFGEDWDPVYRSWCVGVPGIFWKGAVNCEVKSSAVSTSYTPSWRTRHTALVLEPEW